MAYTREQMDKRNALARERGASGAAMLPRCTTRSTTSVAIA